MTGIILFLIFSAIFIIIVYQLVTLRITYTGEFFLKLDFMFICIYFYPQRNKRKNNKQKIKPKHITPAINAIKSLLSKTKISVVEFNPNINSELPADAVVYIGSLNSFFSLLLSYLYIYAKELKFEYSENGNKNELYKRNPIIDLIFETSLLSVISASIIFLYKLIVKRGKKFVRT